MEDQFDRKWPAIFAIGTIVLLAFHHWYAVTEHHVFLVVVFLVPMLAALAIGGLFYPPVFWAIGPRGRNLPAMTKVLGFLLALAGLAVGFYLATFVYQM